MFEWLTHRNALKALQEQNQKLQEEKRSMSDDLSAKDEAITVLSHALVYIATPPPPDDTHEANVPIRLRRRTWLDSQKEYEFENNRELRDYLTRLENHL